jgi:hypothetical protein
LSFAAIDEKHTEDAFEKKENTERKRQQGRQGRKRREHDADLWLNRAA